MFWFCRNPGLSLPLIAFNRRAENRPASIKYEYIEDKSVSASYLENEIYKTLGIVDSLVN